MNGFPVRPAAALAAAFLLAGCGAKVEEAAPPTSDGPAATVTNCGAPLTVSSPPKRVVVNDTGNAELLFALGLTDRIAGYTTYDGKHVDYQTSPWKADFDRAPNLGTAFTREVIQAAKPDLVFGGWSYGFQETTGVTPDWIRQIGAVPYQLTEACRQPGGKQRGVMPPLDALFTDLTDLSTLFGVPERGAKLVADYRARIDAARAAAPTDPARRARVFVFDSGSQDPFTSGRTGTPQAIIESAGAANVFGDLNDSWTTASWEAAAQRDPQVIMIVDYGTGPENTPQAKVEQLRSQPLMAGTTAVREGNFITLPYAALVEGPRTPGSVETLAKYLRSKGF
ncbi:Periplasmic binding protein OS=Tsukamurella paurometabola (strain ATCC 8368 / DSM / CCUG 35730/ CIP 100753 / JCM 10117 / KCTC 9821 / NBRC 16120 / NCIMB 702349 / NCTC 13040) OX=521096 GN=Tpau_2323 PE=4 SV=1 [Tsukamurella paurometabola]|uniref:Periplasmic binding protein n=1 Tax=Tsukamurella paurometabola (strain ATCC 8368 / DSM 20162 / CCUG 35730 / CIP 100753 / JCM 10117 / KCTC 9821 / NBRC 16120 / NCIMB 702349 / NCTC 13040) TaxID=521096 RepID=D5UQG0_TSUPD|nr:ABC transporter substrate-binding protein [Tsukamurella paurometabola]ADG78930.1 periplasmic binding protein [Tsukamurella paurometabola DSM 20162]SUP33540.1 Vitamin B12-binding protein precursor [Tsukamurella paurometabola]